MFAQLSLAALISAILIALSGSPSSSEPLRKIRLHPPVEEEVTRRIEALYAGIPQQGVTLGNPGAPVTLQFFGDLECKESRLFVLGALPFLIRHWVRGGALRIEYRPNPEETIWPDIYNHQEVATFAAGRQGQAWQYLDFFYHEQGPEFTRYAIDHFLRTIAQEVPGLDMAAWTRARHFAGFTQELKRDLRIANSRHIHYTPAFLIGPTGGRSKALLHFSLTETAAFDEAIESSLRRRRSAEGLEAQRAPGAIYDAWSMPVYEFECEKCGERFEELTPSDTGSLACPRCGSARTRRLLSPVSPAGRQPRGAAVRSDESRRRDRESARGERLAASRAKREKDGL